MMTVRRVLEGNEELEELDWDMALVREMIDLEACVSQPVRFYLPDFIRYQSSELQISDQRPWPAFSITAGECKLQCDHCRAEILKPMHPAVMPIQLMLQVTRFIERGAAGMLLSGGSNHQNEVEYAPYYEVIRAIKDEYPDFVVSVHTGLVTPQIAQSLEQAGVDIAMMDVIGSQDTISQVYHLRRTVSDFEASLAALNATSMKIVPHIVLGLHYGNLLGEWRALEMVKTQGADALVLVVLNPMYASKQRPFKTPDEHAIGRFFLDARKDLPGMRINLGCARPFGDARKRIDAYAVMAGLNGIAHPAEGVVRLANTIGRRISVESGCCSTIVNPLSDISSGLERYYQPTGR